MTNEFGFEIPLVSEEECKLRERIEELEEQIKQIEKVSDYNADQLTKAKELLNEFMRISKASDEDFEHDYSELIGETEQFLQDERRRRFQM